MKYVHLEKDTNKLLGWYDDSIHSEIPTPNIEVNDEVWQEAININANCYENGEFIVKDFRTPEEILQRELQIKLAEATQYLKDTGWIWEKFNRNVVVLKDMTEEEFSLKYADTIAEQERNRLLINELELQLGGN